MVDFPKQCWLWGNGLILTPRGSANALLFILFYYTKHSQVCPLHGVKSHIVWQLLCFKFGLMYLVSWLSHMKWTIPVWRLMKSSLLEVLVLLICVHQGWDGSTHIIWVNLTIWGTTLRIVLSTQNWCKHFSCVLTRQQNLLEPFFINPNSSPSINKFIVCKQSFFSST